MSRLAQRRHRLRYLAANGGSSEAAYDLVRAHHAGVPHDPDCPICKFERARRCTKGRP